jgi:gas vesicle protein
MNRLGKLFVAAALAVLPMACKDDVRDDADEAAENVKDQREDVREQSKELKEAIKDTREDVRDHATADTDMGRKLNEEEVESNAKDIADNSKDVAEQTRELKTAEADFAVRRGNRVSQLRVVHSVVSSQPMLINTLGGVTALTDKARADLAEKMQIFQMRVDESGNAIEALQTTDANGFETSNDAAAKAMDRLEDAREDAWEALNDGDRIDAS